MKKQYAFVLFLFFYYITSFSQFNFSISTTSESCPNNGTLTILVSGNTQNDAIVFSVFKLPNVTQAVTSTTNTTISGLSAGDYRIIGTNQNTNQIVEQEASIENTEVILTYGIADGANSCSNRFLTVNITTGTATGYEILAGPVTKPLQSSDTFNGLLPGNYLVRVFDSCGNGITKSHTIVDLPFQTNGLQILSSNFPEEELSSCDEIFIGQQLDVAGQYYIAFPLTFTYTIFPPNGGAPIIITHIYGNPGLTFFEDRTIFPDQPLLFDIPYFTEPYTYNLTVTDGCGNVYTRNTEIISQDQSLQLSPSLLKCGTKGLSITANNFVPPLNIHFANAPQGFNPQDFNANHPIYSEIPIEFGTNDNPVPEGNYSILATDACGREFLSTTTITYEVEMALSPRNTCTSNPTINVTIPGTNIISIQIDEVPLGSPITPPYDASHFISDGVGEISSGIIPGNYVISATDECGNVYTKPVTVLLPQASNFYISTQPDCDSGFGTVLITSSNPESPITSVILVSGSPNFHLPYQADVSNLIENGKLSMSGLPIGNYTAKVQDACGTERLVSFQVNEYQGNTEVEIAEFCSSHNVFLNHTINGGFSNLGYWIQKFNPQTGFWEHPVTGVQFPGVGIPNSNNSILISNNSWTYNLDETGVFRIVTVSSRFASPGESTYCLRVIHEYEISGRISVENVNSFSCSNQLLDVLIDASGRGNLTYRIVERDDQPFEVNNGNNPLFTGLEYGKYVFEIEDSCQNILVYTYQVRAPFTFTIRAQICNNQNSFLQVAAINGFTYRWYKSGNPSVTLSTTPTLNFTPLNLNTHAGIYFVDIIYNQNTNSCSNQTLSYEIAPGQNPNAGNDKTVEFCGIPPLITLADYLDENVTTNGEFTQITPGGNFNTGSWDTSGITPGTYYFSYIVNGFCGETDDAVIAIKFGLPLENPVIDTQPSVCVGQEIVLSISNPLPGNTYQWTGPNNFSSTAMNPVITNAIMENAGQYFVRIVNGNCSAEANVSIAIIAVPNFSLEANNQIICNGQETQLHLTPESLESVYSEINWYFEGNLLAQDVLKLNVNQPGNYSVSISNGNCAQNLSVAVLENQNPFEIAVLAKCENEKFMARVVSVDDSFDENSASYSWTGPENFSANTQVIDLSDAVSGSYEVTVTTENGCEVTLATDIIKSLCNIPKGISPNGDGKNDSWDLSGLDIEKVKIFNRYGTLVYELNDYVDQWKGQAFNGNILPTATYYYYLKLKSGEEKTGWVYLHWGI
ncbi:T9SS type B sorting domain-containing protein [Flavobacterium sp. NST-5]|uniref:T9SS type B sorting domain-containing protein n=1 Tax=Flavobacterium ichthyis TaxID=2698827 RepID=A0ABW9Z440_9FLAO|nr:gliding motility-associated C-terminal domain-containing protein [Flavobacterium ichthyis]NBL63602.1 T9SS type B sorting domain-containing protein [Flavobacterium ichthyis]